jgi:hypothetical protein
VAVKTFFCSACFRPSYALKESIGRESFNCHWCKATSRERAIFLQIHKHYILKKLKNPFRNLKILGVSDGYLTSTVLKKVYKKRYTNFHYHMEPKLDITSVSTSLKNSSDIVSCSEVLEHVEPPIQKAFDGLYQLLKADGVLILSVPHTDLNGKHVEHFPVMTESRITTRESGFVLEGISGDGKLLEFKDLTFHGGIGTTLEYRIFSQESLEKCLATSGFKNLAPRKNRLLFGINWEPWSRVWTAYK